MIISIYSSLYSNLSKHHQNIPCTTLNIQVTLRDQSSHMDKPAIPYLVGVQLHIRRHVPPAPPPRYRRYGNPDELNELKRYGQLQFCLSYPQLEGQVLSNESYVITIVEKLVVGDGHGAQLVVVDDNMVAKIYDPLYYPNPTFDPDSIGHPTRTADHEYTREAAVYNTINDSLGGKEVPRFYGSFTTEIMIAPDRCRAVRLILMEHISGLCMLKIPEPLQTFSQRDRAEIISQMIDADSALYRLCIQHNDRHPRNVMICGTPGEQNLRVVIIDFGQSEILTLKQRNAAYRRLDAHGRTISPILRWRGARRLHHPFRDCGWIDWEWDSWVQERWKDSPNYSDITPEMENFWYMD